jgi:ABC-type transport system involved in multi-copper enzyme maturation permease subunit
LNYALGNTLYALFVAAFFLLLSLIVRRRFLYAAVPAMLVMLVSTTVLGTATALIRSTIVTGRHVDAQATTILTWESGREVLPLEVQQMMLMLRARNLDDYRVSEKLWMDFEQRTIEGLWPARFDPASPNRFRLNTDPDGTSCRFIRQRRNVILERCP